MKMKCMAADATENLNSSKTAFALCYVTRFSVVQVVLVSEGLSWGDRTDFAILKLIR